MADPILRTCLYGARPRLSVLQTGAGEAVVFLHGLGSTKENWDGQLRHFGQTRFVAAWDARGYGGSEDYDGELAFDRDFVGDLTRLLDELGVERAHLVGLSMGGLIAQCFYFAHPQRVATLVLADTFPSFAALGEDTVTKFTEFRLRPLLAGVEPAELAAATVDTLTAPSASEEARSRLLVSLSGLRRESYIKTVQALLGQPTPGQLEDIAVPTLVVVGEFDKLSPVAVSRAMAERIPGSRLVVIAGAGHMSNMERPAEFNSAVDKFLAGHAGVATRVAG